MNQQLPSDRTLYPLSLPAPPQQAARVMASFGISDWTALQTYQAFLTNAGVPFPLAIAPTGMLVPPGVSPYPTQLLSQQYVPPPPFAPAIRFSPVDVSHTDVTDTTRRCICPRCQKEAKPRDEIALQPPGPKSLTCPHCLCYFSQPEFLDAHVRSHVANSSSQGPGLDDLLAKASTHGRPVRPKPRSKNEDDSHRPFACLFCDLKFPVEKSREIHMLGHTSERPYACDLCPWAFTDKWKLAAHQRTHTGLRPYACPRCNESFSQKPTLTRHLRTHTGERPYSCSHCPATFLDSKNLSRHMRVHVGKRGPYSCSECNASFNRKQMLTAHRRVHSGADSGRLATAAKATTSL